MKYRTEIDGLRAIAVIPVILFHAGFQVFSGGFVGVDIFFVISGYLITTILIDDIEQNKFRLKDFYERRARRILPALIVVTVCSIPFALLWMLPYQLKDFSQSLVAITFFSSNILFWRKSGYFDAVSEEKPLLHTWSLAVEEQYYVIFPLFLLLMWRFGKSRAFGAVIFLAIISLVLCEWGWRNASTANFYLAPMRAWELLTGAITSFLINKSPPPTNNTLSMLGLFAIILSIFSYDSDTPYPSLYTLLPVLGTVLIILFGKTGSYTQKILSAKLFVGIGLVSYSAYLWHQPLFAFARIRSYENPSELLMLFLALLSFPLAFLTWKYIENPFRNKRNIHKKNVFSFVLISGVAISILGFSGHITQGFINREPANSHLPDNFYTLATSKPRIVSGINDGLCISEKASVCSLTQYKGTKPIILVGDSHSADMQLPFIEYLNKNKVSGYQLSIGGCGFIPSQYERNKNECSKAVELLKNTLSSTHFSTVLFVTSIYGHAQGSNYLQQDLDAFYSLVKDMSLKAEKVVIFTPRFILSSDPLKAAQLDKLSNVKIKSDAKSKSAVDSLLKRLSKMPNVVLFNQRDILIEHSGSTLDEFNGFTQDTVPLYRDSNHLTDTGSYIVFDQLKHIFPDMPKAE